MWPQAKIKLVMIHPESDSHVTQLDICISSPPRWARNPAQLLPDFRPGLNQTGAKVRSNWSGSHFGRFPFHPPRFATPGILSWITIRSNSDRTEINLRFTRGQIPHSPFAARFIRRAYNRVWAPGRTIILKALFSPCAPPFASLVEVLVEVGRYTKSFVFALCSALCLARWGSR